MSQTETEVRSPEEPKERSLRPRLEPVQREQQSKRVREYPAVISSEARVYFALSTVFIILLMAGVIALGATWLFVPVYVGVAISYIAGALYLFKKLMTY